GGVVALGFFGGPVLVVVRGGVAGRGGRPAAAADLVEDGGREAAGGGCRVLAERGAQRVEGGFAFVACVVEVCPQGGDGEFLARGLLSDGEAGALGPVDGDVVVADEAVVAVGCAFAAGGAEPLLAAVGGGAAVGPAFRFEDVAEGEVCGEDVEDAGAGGGAGERGGAGPRRRGGASGALVLAGAFFGGGFLQDAAGFGLQAGDGLAHDREVDGLSGAGVAGGGSGGAALAVDGAGDAHEPVEVADLGVPGAAVLVGGGAEAGLEGGCQLFGGGAVVVAGDDVDVGEGPDGVAAAAGVDPAGGFGESGGGDDVADVVGVDGVGHLVGAGLVAEGAVVAVGPEPGEGVGEVFPAAAFGGVFAQGGDLGVDAFRGAGVEFGDVAGGCGDADFVGGEAASDPAVGVGADGEEAGDVLVLVGEGC